MSKDSKKEKELLPASLPEGELIYLAGGEIDENRVSVGFWGDYLDPDVISELLGVEPTIAYAKGDKVPVNSEHYRVAHTGLWRWAGIRTDTRTLEEQIQLLFDQLPEDLSIWQDLSTKYGSELFCGIWMKTWNREFDLSPTIMKKIVDRGLTIRFDIYYEESDQK
ncbi:MAG TPA: DUF4279 domain-containing protein [Chloroflexia bacterium]|nr:DUF4279 domain-containing protein [Chloroflexia bacterium]